MSGMIDGVSKLWIVYRKGALDISGFTNEPDAVEQLVRNALTLAKDEDVAALKARFRASFDEAMKHLDDDEREPGDEQ